MKSSISSKEKIQLNVIIMLPILLLIIFAAVITALLVTPGKSDSEVISIYSGTMLVGLLVLIVLVRYLFGDVKFPLLKIIPKNTCIYNKETGKVETIVSVDTPEWLWEVNKLKKEHNPRLLLKLPENLSEVYIDCELDNLTIRFRFRHKELNIAVVSDMINYFGYGRMENPGVPRDAYKHIAKWFDNIFQITEKPENIDNLVKATFEDYFKKTPLEIEWVKLTPHYREPVPSLYSDVE